MTLHRFSSGEQICWQGQNYRIVRIHPKQKLELCDLDGNSNAIVESSQLWKDYAEGHLTFLSKMQDKTDFGLTRVENVLSLDNHDNDLVEIARYRLNIIKPLLNMTSRDQTQSIEALLKQTQVDFDTSSKKTLLTALSRRSIQRWMKDYLDSGKDIRSLIPKTEKRGGKGLKSFPMEVEEIIENVIQDVFMVPESTTITEDVYLEVAARVNELNQARILQGQENFMIPSRATIWRRVGELDPFEVFEVKNGKQAGKRFRRQYLKSQPVEQPLGLVEIDHTQLDVFIAGINIRAYLTVAICKATRVILGFCLSFEPPSYYTVMECLIHAILPKIQIKEKYGTENEYVGCGLPDVLDTDGGKEFIGADLVNGCQELGINLRQMPPRTPQYKGTVERVFRTLNTGLIHKYAGTSFSNTQQRGEYKSIEKAMLSLEELEQDIYLFIVDMYSQRFHKGLNAIPAEEWKRKTSHPSFFLRLPKSARELMILLGRKIERNIWQYGFTFETISYNCDELAILREKLGKKKAKIKFHPGDLSRMYVYDEFNKSYIEVPAVDPEGYTKNLSLWKHRFIRKLARQSQDKPDIIALGRTRRKFRISANHHGKKGKISRRQKARHESVPPSLRKSDITTKDNQVPDQSNAIGLANDGNHKEDMTWLENSTGYATEFPE